MYHSMRPLRWLLLTGEFLQPSVFTSSTMALEVATVSDVAKAFGVAITTAAGPPDSLLDVVSDDGTLFIGNTADI